MLVMSHPEATEICISKPLSESIMTFSDIDTHRKCSNLAIKQPLQGRNHTVICNSDVFIYSYTTVHWRRQNMCILCNHWLSHLSWFTIQYTLCSIFSRHIVYHYYGIRCIYRLKEALRWRHDIWNLLIHVGLKQVFYDRHGFTDFLCLI